MDKISNVNESFSAIKFNFLNSNGYKVCKFCERFHQTDVGCNENRELSGNTSRTANQTQNIPGKTRLIALFTLLFLEDISHGAPWFVVICEPADQQ